MKTPITAAPAAQSSAASKRDSPTDSRAIVSALWTVPNATQEPYTTALREGDWVNLEWEGGTANDTVDLWLAASDFTRFRFSQLITRKEQVNLSADGEFNWTVHVPEVQLHATPQYTLLFKTARSGFEFNSSDPGLPSPGVVILPPGTGPMNPTHNEKDHDDGDNESDSDGESDSGDEDDDDDDEKDETDAAGVNGHQVSANATCGGTLTCMGSAFGNCCSQFNFCGSNSAYCEAGCQSGFGNCDPRYLSVAATAASNSTGQPPHPHLSAGATAAVATAIGASVLGMGILSWFWLRRYRERKKKQTPRLPSTRSSKRPSAASTPRQSEIFEMHGGEKPYEYGRSPPAELYGSSIK